MSKDLNTRTGSSWVRGRQSPKGSTSQHPAAQRSPPMHRRDQSSPWPEKLPRESKHRGAEHRGADRSIYPPISHQHTENSQCKKPMTKLQLKCHFCSNVRARCLSEPLPWSRVPSNVKSSEKRSALTRVDPHQMLRLIRALSSPRSLELFRKKEETFRKHFGLSKNTTRASAKPGVRRAAGGMQEKS